MSSSPKFTIIDIAIELDAAHRAGIARRAAARRDRQERRDEEFRQLRADRAERATAEQRAAIEARLASLSVIIAALDSADPAGARDAAVLAADLAAFQHTVTSAAGGALAASAREAERLRERAIALRGQAQGASDQAAARHAVLTALRERLADPGAEGRLLDPAGYDRCDGLLNRLAAAAREEGVRFEALRGTAEHALTGYAERAVTAIGAARAARAEAADLLAAFSAGVRSAATDARDLHDDDLSTQLEAMLATAADTLQAAMANPAEAGTALARARDLAAFLPSAEARLDDLAAAYERRAAFAGTLKEVLAEQGMSFLGTSETRDRFILQFERPGGALYTAAVDDGAGNELVLSYAIDGEADIPVLPEPGQAVCDQTEDFLDAIHAELAHDGYHAGELRWAGKPTTPRGRRARPARTESPSRQRRIREGP